MISNQAADTAYLTINEPESNALESRPIRSNETFKMADHTL